ncbi:MAG: hypothetical protein ONA90_10700, partial [candidate division KSB1 bacterium]|nr:hypothetical protein [candidate division KSB1 bacterium]
SRLVIHVEPFFKASLNSETPGLTGWTSLPVPVRACYDGTYYNAEVISRPDVVHAFYIPLHKLSSLL